MVRDIAAGTDTTRKAALRALVVDDIPEICDLYRALFRRIRGIDVDLTVETDPSEAIRRVGEASYDLVISDFRMKHADGVDVLTAARAANPRGRRILMTGYNEIPTTIERIREARIDAYVQKPLNAQDLLLMMTDVLTGDEDRLAKYREEAHEMEEIALREERMEASSGSRPPPGTRGMSA